MADKKISELTSIVGADTAADDFFVVVDTSGSVTKKISRAELNNAIEQDVLAQVDITSANIDGGTIDNTPIGSTTASTGNFTTVDTTGNVTVGGNLTVNGTTTTVNSTTLDVDDINITVASGAASAAAADGAGLTVDGASATFNYASSGDKWTMNKPLDITGTLTADGLTVDGDAQFTQTTNLISTNSSDGSDNKRLFIGGGGASPSSSRGGLIGLYGNEYSAGGGVVNIQAGNISTGYFNVMTGGANRLRIANNGDVSLYADDGTTQGFYWDASTQRLGVGETSPDTTLHAKGSITVATIESTAANSDIQMKGSGTTGYTAVRANAETLALLTAGTNAITIDGSQNVGIGTSSPASYPIAPHFVVDAGTNGGITIRSGSSHYGGVFFADGTTGNEQYRGFVQYNHNYAGATDSLIFGTSAAEKMRIDSSGRLLVGKTSTGGGTTEGTEIHSDGYTQIVRDSASTSPVLYLGKLINDGEIVRLTKDGTTVGSIGTSSSNLYVATTTSGVRFNSNGSIPCDNTGATADDTYDLGQSSVRWQDLYLSGGVYLGGTGSANYLDDYEEGTWTPTLGPVYEALSSVTALTSSSGTYTKIGNKVFIKGAFVTDDSTTITSDAGIRITGIPFTAEDVGSESNPTSGAGALRGSLTSSNMSYFNAAVTGSTLWFTFKIHSGTGGSADDNFSFFLTYETT